MKDIQKEWQYIYLFRKIYKLIKIKVSCFYILSFIESFAITYYLFIFCQIYKKSQISLVKNFFLGEVESMIKSFSTSLIICIMRFMSLKCKLKSIYRSSLYLNDLL